MDTTVDTSTSDKSAMSGTSWERVQEALQTELQLPFWDLNALDFISVVVDVSGINFEKELFGIIGCQRELNTEIY